MERVFKIGFVSISRQFLDCDALVAEDLNIEMVTALADTDTVVPIGLKMEREGVEVIISRRITASQLQQHLKIPVLSLRTTFTDIFLNLRNASLMGKKILLTLFEDDEVAGIDLLENLFNVIVIPGIYHDLASLEATIIRGKEQGCQIVIGGAVSTSLAQKHGLEGLELRINKGVFMSTIDDALSVARANREEQEKAVRYRTIMDATSEGIVALDKNGLITAINHAALQSLALPEPMIGKPFAGLDQGDYLQEVLESGRPVLNKVVRLGGETFVANLIPLQVGAEVVGAVVTFRDVVNVVRAEHEVRRSLFKGLVARNRIDSFVHRHPAMKEVVEQVKKFSQVDSTILITGETGTGKEILAQSIHNLSPRREGPFVSINCAAIPEQLLESELFGYDEGAFTGSRHGGKPGLFELAHKGTIFLDEVGVTPLSVQSRLLRVLQEREVMRVGGDRLISVNVRVIAATNRNLCLEVQQGRFREDLYFRLDVINILIPPLRERIDDLPLLIQDLIRRCARTHKAKNLVIPDCQLKKLMALQWPGNVRQLQNFVENLVILCDDGYQEGTFEKLYAKLLDYSLVRSRSAGSERQFLNHQNDDGPKDDEARAIRKAMEESRFIRSRAAKKLGISRTTLWRKLREMSMQQSNCPG